MDRILIVDDDVELCGLVARYLTREGFEVKAVHNGTQGVEESLSGQYVLVVLDVMLPGLTGFEVLRLLRAQSAIPVLMLTARGDDVDRIVGLEIGADDYLPKPCNPRELVARIRAILRRTKSAPPEAPAAPPEPGLLRVGDVEMDLGARVVRRAGQVVELTGAEFDLLAVLLRSAGQVISREELVRSVLNRPLLALDRSIDTLVSNLRRKLGRPGDGMERIKSVRGSGFVYARPSEVVR
ncbi:MAG: response regulator transcription factor [Armatimonadota bacterium]|nr:response regulator transcription factor [Armatimonadota bacterium]